MTRFIHLDKQIKILFLFKQELKSIKSCGSLLKNRKKFLNVNRNVPDYKICDNSDEKFINKMYKKIKYSMHNAKRT